MAGEGVAAEHGQRVVGARADDRDPAVAAQRQRPGGIGEQHARLFRQLPGQGPVLRRVEVHRRTGLFGVGAEERGGQRGPVRVEQSELALLEQHPVQCPVDQFLGHGAVPYSGHEHRPVAMDGGQLHVDPGAQCEAGRVGAVGGDLVQGLQEADAEVVGDDGAGEAPGVPEESGEQGRVGGRGQSVDLRVGVHHRAGAAFAQCHLEGREDDVGHLACPGPDRRVVAGARRRGVSGEVFEGGDDVGGLQAADIGGADGGDEVRVLADGLLDASPAQIAHHVEDGGEALVDSDGPHVAADPAYHLGHQLRVPGGAPRQWHGVGGGAPRGEARQALLVGEGGVGEPAGLGDPVLGAGQCDRADARVDRCGAERPGQLAESVGGDVLPVNGVHVVLVRRDSVAVGVGAHPDSVQLGGLLLQGHPGHEVGHSFLGGE